MSMRSVQAMDVGYAPPQLSPPGLRVGTGPPPASGAVAHSMPAAGLATDHATLIAWLVIFGALVLLRVAAESAREE